MKISIILFCVLLFGQSAVGKQANAKEDYNYSANIDDGDETDEYYDTIKVAVHDTVYVSDIDGFLKQYGCNLGTFAKKYGPMKRMVDSINKLSEDRLYYNYFLPRSINYKLSSRFMAKTFRIKEGVLEMKEAAVSDVVDSIKKVRREVLFSCSGINQTIDFLQNPVAINQVISGIFTFMQQQENSTQNKIKGINLYFSDFSLADKRSLVQFVKSVRIIMDASQNFKPPKTRLNVTLLPLKGSLELDRGLLYALMQEATEVICLNSDLIDSCYVNGKSFTALEELDVTLLDQIVSHYYIARFYTGDKDLTTANLTRFSGEAIRPYLQIDYAENSWEIYLLLFLVNILLFIIVVVLYYTCLPVSTFMNQYIESVVLLTMMMLLELLAMAISTFQHMSHADDFSQLKQHPLLLFSLPFIIMLMIPLFKGISKKRRIP